MISIEPAWHNFILLMIHFILLNTIYMQFRHANNCNLIQLYLIYNLNMCIIYACENIRRDLSSQRIWHTHVLAAYIRYTSVHTNTTYTSERMWHRKIRKQHMLYIPCFQKWFTKFRQISLVACVNRYTI